MPRLSLGQVGVVLGGLKRMQARAEEAVQAMANCGASRAAHRGRPASRKLRRGGDPLGSGGLDASNTFLGPVRHKRSGTWWDEAHSHHLLAR